MAMTLAVFWISKVCKHFTFLGIHNKTDRHEITEILLKVALITITLTLQHLTALLWYISQETPLRVIYLI
jgi:uncharacterized membrane protein